MFHIPDKTVIIAGGGTGTRMKSDVPKQFLLLGGKPVIIHSVEAFASLFPGIRVIIALPETFFGYWEELCRSFDIKVPHRLCAGGEKRFHTVRNALELVPDDDLVAVHDAVRPLVAAKTIEEGFRNALTFGNAVPSLPLNDSVRWVEEADNRPVPRENLRTVQTPQVFQAALLKRAYRRTTSPAFTDDASVVEAMGEKIHLYEGNPENIKITTPGDLEMAEMLIRRLKPAD